MCVCINIIGIKCSIFILNKFNSSNLNLICRAYSIIFLDDRVVEPLLILEFTRRGTFYAYRTELIFNGTCVCRATFELILSKQTYGLTKCYIAELQTLN